MDILKRAEQIAREAHEGQKRWSGEPYITHPEAVANSLKETNCKIVAWLHDVLEDTETHSNDLLMKGIPRELVIAIEHLTRDDEFEDYGRYILQIRNNEIAKKVKIADLKHNLSDLKKGSMKDKYLLSLYILEES